MFNKTFDFDAPRSAAKSRRTRCLQYVAALGVFGTGLLCTRLSLTDLSLTRGDQNLNETTASRDALRQQPTAESYPSGADVWQESWQRMIAQPRCPSADRAAAELLEQLARRDPEAALSLAQAAKPHDRRLALLCGALRGWASVSPAAAAGRLSHISGDDLEEAEQAVMTGAVARPGEAVEAAQQLISADPAGGRSHANHLLRALNDCGDFSRAIAFASSLPAELRDEMIATAYQYWARSQPDVAFAAATALPQGDMRNTALDAAISGWAHADPQKLAEHALTAAGGATRTAALQAALCQWVLANPKAASDWIDQFDPTPELDAGAAAVALHPELVESRPEIAASWAESITQPELRSTTLLGVLREWISRDAAAALAYAQSSQYLASGDRSALLQSTASSDYTR